MVQNRHLLGMIINVSQGIKFIWALLSWFIHGVKGGQWLSAKAWLQKYGKPDPMKDQLRRIEGTPEVLYLYL